MICLKLPGANGCVFGPFGSISPEVGARRSLRAWSNTVTPIVAVSKTATGPTDDRRLDPPQGLNQGVANASSVRHLGIFTYPDTVINNAAQVLGEMSVDIG